VANDTDAVLEHINAGKGGALGGIARKISAATDSPAVPALVGGGVGLAYLAYRQLRSDGE
jgi:hypothetical protein